MKKLILIFGDLASGKSTFATTLSNKYGIPLFTKDILKEILADTIGFSDRKENLRLSHASFVLMEQIVRSLSVGNGDLILESNFREGELCELMELSAQMSYDVLPICLYADEEILYKRFMERISKGRHRAHITADLTDHDSFCKYIKNQRHNSLPENTLKISANDFSYQFDEKIQNVIESFL